MQITFNPRRNGACPFCTKEDGCTIRDKLAAAVSVIRDEKRHGMELVIYSCPSFEETS
jgi:hypothetical protein